MQLFATEEALEADLNLHEVFPNLAAPPRIKMRRAAAPKPKVLRNYQGEAVRAVVECLADKENLAKLLGPTGAGKTTTIVGANAYLSHHPGAHSINRSLILCPQNQIKEPFARGGRIELDGVEYDTDGLIREAKSTDDVRAFLRRPKPRVRQKWSRAQGNYGLVYSHQGAVMLTDELTAAMCKDLAVWVDEAHCVRLGANPNALGRFVLKVLELGGYVIPTTATAFRHTGETFSFDSISGFSLSIADYAMMKDENGESFMPQKLRIEIDSLRGFRAKDAREYYSDRNDSKSGKFSKKTRQHIIDRWINDGKPYVMVVLQPGDSPRIAKLLTKDFEKAGARVLNGTGVGAAKAKEFQREIEHDQTLTRTADAKYDIVIVCMRGNMGTDWPVCSHVYMMGFPNVLWLMIQRWGRAMRLKLMDHPHRDVASLVCFLPEGLKGVSSDEEKEIHREASMMLGCALEDYGAIVGLLHRTTVKAVRDKAYDVAGAKSTASKLIASVASSDMDRNKARIELVKIRANNPDYTLSSVAKEFMGAKHSDEVMAAGVEVLTEQFVKAAEETGESDAIRTYARSIRHHGERRGLLKPERKTATPKQRRQARDTARRLIRDVGRDVLKELADNYEGLECTEIDGCIHTCAKFSGESCKYFCEQVTQLRVAYTDLTNADFSKSNKELADAYGVCVETVIKARKEYAPETMRVQSYIDLEHADFSKKNRELREEYNVCMSTVTKARKEYAPGTSREVSKASYVALASADFNKKNGELAEVYGVTTRVVTRARHLYAKKTLRKNYTDLKHADFSKKNTELTEEFDVSDNLVRKARKEYAPETARGKALYIKLANADFSKSNVAIAQEYNVSGSVVVKARNKYAQHTLQKTRYAALASADFENNANLALSGRYGVSVATVRKARKEYAPHTLRSDAQRRLQENYEQEAAE